MGTQHLVSHPQRRLPHPHQWRNRFPLHLRRTRRPRPFLREARWQTELRGLVRRPPPRPQLRQRRQKPHHRFRRQQRPHGRERKRTPPPKSRPRHHQRENLRAPQRTTQSRPPKPQVRQTTLLGYRTRSHRPNPHRPRRTHRQRHPRRPTNHHRRWHPARTQIHREHRQKQLGRTPHPPQRPHQPNLRPRRW